MSQDHRLHTRVSRGPAIAVRIDGRVVQACAGETIAGVLAAIGQRTLRHTEHRREPRGPYCLMGLCHECLVTVNGQANVRACVTPIEAGQEIVLQDGLGRYEPAEKLPPIVTPAVHRVPLAVIGAGPAGLSAALAAAEAGIEVLVIDDNPQIGGQIYRQLPAPFELGAPGDLGPDYLDGQRLLRRVQADGDRITIWSGASLAAVFEPRQLAIARPDDLVLVEPDAIVVATGAYERPVPVPGWTLPGVLATGGAQALVKTQQVRPGRRAIMAGTGPLQLVVANQLLDAGVEVVAIAEAAPGRGAWRPLPALLRQPRLLWRGVNYMWRLGQRGVPLLRGHVLKAVEGAEGVERVVLTRVDPGGGAIPGTDRILEADTVCVGYGLLPQTAATRLLGCGHEYSAEQAAWLPRCDGRLATDQPGVFAAGDCAGVAGILVAREQGMLAGISAAEYLQGLARHQAERRAAPIHKRLGGLRGLRRAMDQAYPHRLDLYAHMTDDTVVCRCEEITAGQIRQAIRDGTADLNDIKKRCRAGMGYCQGANCLPAVTAMLEREFGVSPEAVEPMTQRPPIKPLPMGLLMMDPGTDE